MNNTQSTIDTAAASAPFENILHQSILREHFLLHALRHSSRNEKSLGGRDYDPLIEDLSGDLHELHHLSDGLLLPALSALSSSEARQWEKDLVSLFSSEHNEWEKTLRLSFELEAITGLLRQMCQVVSFEEKGRLETHLAQLSGHKIFQDEVMRNWIISEQSRGNRIDHVIEHTQDDWRGAWDRVLASCGLDDSSGNLIIPINSWRSLSQVTRNLVSAMLHPGKPRGSMRIA